MNRSTVFTLLALAVVVIATVATWLTIPSGRYEEKDLTAGRWNTSQIAYPARLFRPGLPKRERVCSDPFRSPADPGCPGVIVLQRVDLHALKQRVVVAYGGLAVAVVLVGLAFGALRRTTRAAGLARREERRANAVADDTRPWPLEKPATHSSDQPRQDG